MRKHNQGVRVACRRQGGFTIVELVVGLTVLTVVALSFLGLFISLVRSAAIAKQKAVASTLATNQMEYLKSLPYDALAVAGGAIYSANPLPNSSIQKLNGVKFTVKTSINYVDDAFDGCGSYPTPALRLQYCRNYPAPTGAPATDTNPADYKSVHVTTYSPSNARLAEVDTQIAAKVSETASTTGALFVKVVDEAGNPVSGTTVTVANTTVTPNVNASDSSDSNGIAIFYGLPPDTTGTDYTISGSKTDYSSLATIKPSGTLQPTYPSQNILTQQSSFVTLTLKPAGPNSLVVETTNTAGTALAGVKVYVKGGYKKYTATTDTSYYFDSLTPTDTRPTTDAAGLAAVSNLVPGNYIFCGDAGATSCSSGATTYYVTAAVPYSGTNSFNPVVVPSYYPANPPSVTFPYGAGNYYQKVRLMLSTSASFPRVQKLAPAGISLASDPIGNMPFTVNGVNLPCSSSASSCATTVKFTQSSNTYTASCTGTSAGLTLTCTANLSGITNGTLQMTVSNVNGVLALPGSPMIGGFIVAP